MRTLFGKRATSDTPSDAAPSSGPPRDVRRGKRKLTLADLPADLAAIVDLGQNAQIVEAVVRDGRFEKTPAATVHAVIEWAKRTQAKCNVDVMAHPQFAEFFPEQAEAMARAEAAKAATGIVLTDAQGRLS